MTAAREVISPDGIPIAYDVAGSGSKTLVFVHGWTCNRSHWRDQVREFSGRFRTIAIDLAGHGESGQGRTDWNMSAFAGDVAAVFDQEQVSGAVLIGHSMGGMVIAHSAQKLGERVVGIVGADTFKYLRDDPPVGRQAEQLRQMHENFESVMTSTVGSMFSDTAPEDVQGEITAGMLATPREVALGAMSAMATDIALFDVVAGLDVPKAAINARERPMDERAAREAGVDFRFMKGSGHFVMNEDAGTFNGILGEVLEGIF